MLELEIELGALRIFLKLGGPIALVLFMLIHFGLTSLSVIAPTDS